MMTIKKIVVLTIVLFSAQNLMAQIEGASQNSSGSFYSLFGVGFPTDNNTPREYGLGISGVSLDYLDSNTLQNPALWGKNVLTTASSGFNFSQYKATSNTSSSVNALLDAGYFQVTFPVAREKVGISASMYSVTRSNYRFANIDSTSSSATDAISYASDIRGAGGVNKLEIGFGWNINENLAIGYAPSLAFVSENSSQDVFFSDSDYGTSNLDSKITGSAFAHRFGALINLRKLFTNRDRLSFGASASLPFTINATETVSVSKTIDGRQQDVVLRENENGKITLPIELNAGLTYYPMGLVNFSVEGLYEQWSNFESTFSSSNELSMMSDRIKAGFGAEYHPYRTNSSKFLSSFRYSGGVSFDSGHLTIQNQDINTLWFSAGLGIISPRSRSSVDLSIRYGLRGTTNNNLIKEQIWAFNLSINLSELMFFRQKLN